MVKKTQECDKVKRNYEAQIVLGKLIEISVKDIPLEEMLEEALALIISIPWLSVGAKGVVFLIKDGKLVMTAQKGLSAPLLEKCKTVELGQCICGHVAATEKMVYSSCVDEMHSTTYEGMVDHGHYCAPIMSVEKKVLGVMNLYLKDGSAMTKEEKNFLKICADTVAGLIIRKKAEEDLYREKEKLESRVKERTAELRRANENLEERIKEHQAVEETLLELYRYAGITNRRISMLLDLKRSTNGKTLSEAVEFIVDFGTELSGASSCALYEYQEENNNFYLLAANGVEGGAVKRNISAEDNVFFQKIINDKAKVYISGKDINKDALQEMGIESGLSQLLIHPLFIGNKMKYVILFGFRDLLEFNKQEVSFYGAFAMQASVALEGVG